MSLKALGVENRTKRGPRGENRLWSREMRDMNRRRRVDLWNSGIAIAARESVMDVLQACAEVVRMKEGERGWGMLSTLDAKFEDKKKGPDMYGG